MATISVYGEVIAFGPDGRNIRVRNVDEVRQFWAEQNIATNLDWAGTDPPLVTIGAQQFVQECEPGDEVRYVLETRDRANGRGVQGIDLEVLAKPLPQADL